MNKIKMFLEITPDWVLSKFPLSIGQDMERDSNFITLVTDFNNCKWVDLALETLGIEKITDYENDESIYYKVPLDKLKKTCPNLYKIGIELNKS